jgi:hypothetical protein
MSSNSPTQDLVLLLELFGPPPQFPVLRLQVRIRTLRGRSRRLGADAVLAIVDLNGLGTR